MNDEAYFLKRAETQVALAHRASDEKSARAHYELAGFYWDRAFNPPLVQTRRQSGQRRTPGTH
jgi:hypothetical protein